MSSNFEEGEDVSGSLDVGVSGNEGRVAVRGLGQQMSRGGSGNRGRGAGRGQHRRARGADRGRGGAEDSRGGEELQVEYSR